MPTRINNTAAALNTVMIYARDMDRTARFYESVFGFVRLVDDVKGLITLMPPDGGACIVIHQAAKSVKLGQVGVKMIFSVTDVDAFKERSAALGVKFGATHRNEDYAFANAKDPDKNSVAISSRQVQR